MDLIEKQRVDVPNDDTISRKAAIDAIESAKTARTPDGEIYVAKLNAEMNIQILPSAKPDIITCKDCKYHDENWRRVSVRWLPCMDMRTGSNWFCGSAERRTDG